MSNRRLIVRVQRRGGIDNDAAIEAHARKVLAEMLSTRLLNTMRITIKLRVKVQGGAAFGTCGWREFSKGSTARSKHYTIHLMRDRPMADQLRTLTHELKHAEQMARGRLTVRRTYGVWGMFWRPGTGNAVKYPLGADGDLVTPWAMRPWEIEARAAEEEFAHLV